MAQVEAKSSMEAVRKELFSKIENLTVGDLHLPNKPIVLDVKTDPKKAIEILLKNKIRAAPTVDGNQFVGVLDLRDTVKYALDMYSSNSDKKAKALEWLTVSPQITTQNLKYLSRMREFATVKKSDSLITLAKILAKGNHIVGVTNEARTELLTICTQGQLFQEMYTHWAQSVVHDCKLALLKEARFITSPVKTINSQEKASVAFETMSAHSLSGLAVVDQTGKIIHNTSATDIKLWLIASNTLEDTIEQFLINIRKLSLTEKYPITVCGLNDSLSRGLAKLQATKYHRLWIVDKDTRPVGVLALTDIFKFVVNSPPKPLSEPVEEKV